MPLPPADSPFGKPIQPELSKEIMEAFMRLPGPLTAQMEGKAGPVELPPEQLAEAMRNVLLIFMKHLPNLAGKLDLVYSAVAELERKVYETEGPA